MRKKTITMVITKDPEDKRWYNVRVPSLPGCVSCGRTVEEAIANGEDVIAGFLQVMEEDGVPIPTEAASVAVPV